MSKRKWTDQDFVEAVRSSYSYAQVIEKLHLRIAGSNYDTVKRKIQEKTKVKSAQAERFEVEAG